MPKSNIPSPAHSVGAKVTPRRYRHRSSRSMNSPARSTASGRLSTIIDQFKENNRDSFAVSPLSKTVLSDNTDIEQPRRESWWRKVENSRDVIDVLENEKPTEPIDMIEELDIEILSQEKKDYTMDLPESSGSESISSIVIPQRKLFTQKENLLQNNFGHIIGSRESLTKNNKTNIQDKTMANVGTKNLFNRGPKRSKPVFPAELLTLSPDKTVANKTKELAAEVKGQAKNLFGNRPGAVQKNMFVNCNFIVSESEDEIPDIQPRVFAFPKNSEPWRKSSAFRGARESSPTSSITTDLEMDDWNLLPSSTMVEHQLEDMATTPGKRAGLSKLSEVKESEFGTNTSSTVNKTKQSNKSLSSKNKSKTSESVATKEQKLEKSVSSKNKTESSENADVLDNVPRKDLIINKSLNKSKINRSSSKTNKSQQKETENKEYDKDGGNNLKNTSQILNTIASNQLSRSKNHEQEVTTLDQADTEIQPHQIALNEVDEIEDDEDIALTYEEDDQQNDLVEGTAHNNVDCNKNKEEQSDEDMETPLKEKSHLKGSKVVEKTPETEKLIVLEQPEELQVKVNKSYSVEHATIMKEKCSNEDEPSNKNLETSIHEHDVDDPKEIEDEEELEASDNQDAIASDDENETDQQEQSAILEEDEADDENDKAEIIQESSNVVQNESQEIGENEEPGSGQEEVEYEDEEEKDEQDASQQEVDEQDASQQEVDEQDASQQEVDEQDASQQEVDEQDASQEEVSEQHISEEEIDDQDSNQEEVEEQEASHEEMDKLDASREEQEVSEEEMDEQDASQEEVDEQEASNEEVEVDEHSGEEEIENDSQEIENTEEHGQEELEHNSDTEKIEEPQHSETHTPNVTHDTTGRNRNKEDIQSPEAILHDKTNDINSFIAKGRNTSMRKTLLKNSTIRPSLMPARESTGISDGTRNSSAEGSGWDSHRTTRKTLRQTFGKDFTPRKSLRTLVMEKSAKRQTTVAEANAQLYHEDNSAEIPADAPQDVEMDYDDNVVDNIEESDHEISRKTRQTNLEMYMEKIKKDNMERKQKIEEQVRNSLKSNPVRLDNFNFRIPANPAIRRRKLISLQTEPKVKRVKQSVVAFEDLPEELIADMNYKPPKRYKPSNASWITQRLYKFLETKLEPKYDYKARIRAEKLVETIYEFAKDLRRQRVAPTHAVTELKRQMARLDVVKTHFEFYNFFHDYMPLEIKVKVVPDIVNNIPLPREGVFSNILV